MAPAPTTHPRRNRRLVAVAVVALAGLALLTVPAPAPDIALAPSTGAPFRWDRDTLWQAHEAAFIRARSTGCADTSALATEIAALQDVVGALGRVPVAPTAMVLDTVESRFFALTAGVAACPASLDAYLDLHVALGRAIKWQSRLWDVGSRPVRERLYRTLYGSRAAAEEVMLQHPDRMRALQLVTPEPSASPGAVVQGVRVHSGDILVSRGGYPTSALIARGNDYPGNFSHVGLVHVDSVTGDVSVIEAHIERGVAITTAEGYLADKKLRLMVLRPRADMPPLREDPLLPHRAATSIRDRALAEHIPYDFTMDYQDPSRLFCSEVASAAYREHGIELWSGISTITREGLRRWLGAFGVRHFETQEPSDLEYDPQLVMVAEWRDPTELFRDHVANAVTDAMLEGADRGDALDFAWHQLPVARVAKGYSWAVARVGRTGPIPEGMSPAAALRNRAYSARHTAITEDVMTRARQWQDENGYAPAYWTLVALAREAVAR